VLTVVVSSAALLSWDKIAMMPRPGYPWMILAGIFFAVVNAVLEETAWPSVIMQSLGELHGPREWDTWRRSFGLWSRASAGSRACRIYGYMLGYLGRCSGGMLSPILAHVFADATIFITLLHTAGR
jgi:uncharacterized protein